MLLAGMVGSGFGVSGCGGTRQVMPPSKPRLPIEIGVECKAGPHRPYRASRCRRHIDARSFIGMVTASAVARARALGLEMRIVETDGKPLRITLVEEFGRVDVATTGGRITKIVHVE
jgi:hypothetical protein